MSLSEQHEGVSELRLRLAKTEHALERAERHAIAGRFGAEMIHEINNPLEAVTNLAYLLKAQQLSENARVYLEMMDEQIRRMHHISRQTLAFHRTAEKPLRTDLVELLKIAIRTYNHKIAEMRLRVELDLPPVAECEVYPGELTQAFANLISNAIEASDEGGVLKVRLRTAANHVSVTVCDSGCGIPSEMKNSLFDAFCSGKEAGNGLGLWICRRIVEKHGGFIRWRSCTSPPKSGTTFRILLGKSPAGQIAAGAGSAGNDAVRQSVAS